MTTTEPRFASAAEVAGMLRVSKQTIYRLVERGELPSYRIGNSIRIPIKAIWRYLEAQSEARNVG